MKFHWSSLVLNWDNTTILGLSNLIYEFKISTCVNSDSSNPRIWTKCRWFCCRKMVSISWATALYYLRRLPENNNFWISLHLSLFLRIRFWKLWVSDFIGARSKAETEAEAALLVNILPISCYGKLRNSIADRKNRKKPLTKQIYLGQHGSQMEIVLNHHVYTVYWTN